MLLTNDVLGNVRGLVRVQRAGRSIRYGPRTNHHPSLRSERWTARKNEADPPFDGRSKESSQGVLHAAHGLYTEVDICTEDGTIEKIQNPAVASEVGAI